MKTIIQASLILAVSIPLFMLSSCQDRYMETYELSNPVYLSYDDLRAPISDTSPEEFNHPGKIYLLGDYIFVNEIRKGIHVVDNADPENPVVISFIKIPGNIDMAIKNEILYADSYVDLIAIDISDLDDIKELARFEDVFSYSLPPYESSTRLGQVDESQGVVVSWKTEEVTEEVERHYYDYNIRFWESNRGMMDMASSKLMTGGGSQSVTGTGGSMARFIIYENILYTIDNSDLHMFDITDELSPISAGTSPIGWNIETVFIAKNHLFVGSTSGMYIYSLYDPVNPQWVSTYWHVTSCDPVVVEGDYAYVTLRTGNTCEGDVNQLDIVDIHNLSSPIKIKSYPMHNPHGLGIDDGTLFLCDGEAGLKIYDANDPLQLKNNQLAHFSEINTFDVIPISSHLVMIGEEGLYQYDYSDLENIELLSMIPIFSD
jgi:hypothetical protein